MIVEYIRYELNQSSAEALVSAYRDAGEHLKLAPQCRGYELTVCEEAPSSVILRIIWTSTKDHLEGFCKGPNFLAFFQAIKTFIVAIAVLRHSSQSVVAGVSVACLTGVS